MDAVEDIKSRLSIEDVVSQYVELKRAGRNFKGLSPFGNERTPSFMVSPEKQIWHDFSSGKGGNMFSFVMEMEGLDFKGALELLARKAGVDLDQYRGRSTSNGKEKERLYEALALAARFYQVQFKNNQIALEYVFKKRQFTKQTAQEWLLGYSPNNGSALCEFLQKKGFSEKEIKDSGLSSRNYRGLSDMFRGRLMIPLQDQQGRVIGFTARLLEENPEAPKYINTPQTLLYDKSRHVYGLHLAKEAIRKSKYSVIAEGNLDVIASHQAGVRQVVATAGTALTEYQLKALGRFTPDIRLAFDADNAGLNATERSIPIASKVGVTLSMITIPSGKDPDELIKQDKSKWEEIIEKPTYALDWLIERYQKQLDVKSAVGKRQFSDIILQTIKGLSDRVEQEHYLTRVAEIVGVSREALADKLSGKQSAPLKRPRFTIRPVDKDTSIRTLVQNHLMAILLKRKASRRVLDTLSDEMFVTDEAKQLFVFLSKNPDFDEKSDKIEELKPIADYVKVLLFIYEEEHYQDLDSIGFDDTVKKLQSRLIVSYAKSQNNLTNEAYIASEGDDQKRKLLAERSKYLQSLLEQYKSN